MAKKARRSKVAGASTVEAPAAPSGTARERIIAALMQLLAERPYQAIDLAAIAERAGVGLDAFRGEFNSVFAVLAAFSRHIDTAVLAGGDPDDGEESPRERLFDVLMRRYEALAPYRDALASLRRSARRDLALTLALNGLAVRSMGWMMAAAGIDGAGPRGLVRAQALTAVMVRVGETFLEDDDPGLARTMAKLDRELSRGAMWSRRLDDLCSMLPRVGGWRRRHRDSRPGDEAAPAAAI